MHLLTGFLCVYIYITENAAWFNCRLLLHGLTQTYDSANEIVVKYN